MKTNILIISLGIILIGLLSAILWNQQNPKIVTEKEVDSKTSTTKVQDSNTTPTTTSINEENKLDLSGTKLIKLPEYVLNETSLVYLDISNNNISGALPSEIGKLTNLVALIAGKNKMTGVPAEVGRLEKLEVLDLSNNQLTGLPYELGNLKKLKVLDLSGNNYAKADLDIIMKSLPKGVKVITD